MSEPGTIRSNSYPDREKIIELLRGVPESYRKTLPGVPIRDLQYVWPPSVQLSDSQKEAIRTRLRDQMRMIPKDPHQRLADFILRPTLRRTKVDLIAKEAAVYGLRENDSDERITLTEHNISGIVNSGDQEVIFGPEDSVMYLTYFGIPVDRALPGMTPSMNYVFLRRDGRLVNHWFEDEEGGESPLVTGIESAEDQLAVLLHSLDLFEWGWQDEDW